MFLTIVGNAVWGQTGNWIDNASTDWYGDGSASEFTVSTAEQLAGLASLVNEGTSFEGKTIKLGADIILNENSEKYKEWETTAPEKEWTPIGTTYNGFSGTFDGCGHIISGLYINENENKTNNYYGLFAKTVGTITHVQVINSYIEANSYLGGIVGYIGNSGEITKCSFVGIIKAKLEDANNQSAPESRPLYCGGICGSQNSPNGIESCFFKGRIEAEINNCSDFSGKYIGGIVGYSMAGTIKDCYNEGTIAVSGSENSVTSISIGGIAGFPYSIYGCYNIGAVTVSVENNPQSANVLPPVSTGGIVGTANIGGVKYCYNTGEVLNQVQTGTNYKIGGIVGYTTSSATLEKNYVLSTDESTTTGITSATEEQFKSGEVAWNLRGPFTLDDGTTIGYGQALDENGKYIDDESPVLLAFEENEGTEVYQLKLKVNDSDKGTIYRNSKESNLLSEDEYNELLQDAVEKDLVWKDEEGNVIVSGNKYIPTKDIALTATIDNVYDINTEVTPEDAGTISVKESAAEGETVSFTVTANEGYELASVSAGEVSLTEANGSYSFTMPAANVTITATFNKVETEQPGDDEDEDQGNTGIHKPQHPIKYYNIYVDTICPGLNVEVSKDVVQEGHQVSAYLTIQAECDTTGMRFEYKRGLFGYWKDLKELEGVQPGEYIIKNIYTDIYIRALDATLPEEEPTGIDDLEGVKAYAKDGSIYVYTPNREEVTIIGMTGAIIKNEEQVGLQSYSVSRGIYIVRIGEKVFKLKN